LNRFYPAPPHISAAFYFDHLTQATAFAEVCDQVMAVGATPTGAYELIRTAVLPHFAMISDLGSRLESAQISLPKKRAREEWNRWINSQELTSHILRAAFKAPQIGIVIVAFEPTSEVDNVRVVHPIAVTTSGALLSMPEHISQSHRERSKAARVARYLLSVFRSVCESLDPLYGAIAVEASLPTPAELGGGARLGTELYVSNRLGIADPTLVADLSTIFANGFTERWKSGMYFSGWAAFNQVGQTLDKPLEAGARAAQRIGQALTA
jgi:hypothetical protein